MNQPSTIANLLSLPNEMLMCFYEYSSTHGSAVSISIVNRILRFVWLKHINDIAGIILRRQIAPYQDAVDLAALEA